MNTGLWNMDSGLAAAWRPGMTGLDLNRKRVAAAAGGGGVRVLDLERGAHQILDEVDLGAVQEIERHVIDDDLNPVALEDEIIGVSLLVEGESVLKTGTAAARDRNAQEGAFGLLLLLQRGNAARRALGDDNRALAGDLRRDL